MKILNRYLISRILNFFFITLPALTGVYMTVDIFEKMDDFLEAGANVWDTALYFILMTPSFSFELFPMALLLAGLLALSVLIKHKEYLALRAVGISDKEILRPILLGTGTLALFALIFQGIICHHATSKAHAIWRQEVEKIPALGSSTGRFFYRGKGTIWSFKNTTGENLVKDVHLVIFDSNYRCSRVIQCEKGIFMEGAWRFIKGQSVNCTNPNTVNAHFFEELDLRLSETPESFSTLAADPRDIGVFQLGKNILKLKRIGVFDRTVEAIFWNRLMYPFFGVALLYLGLVLLFSVEGVGISLGFSLGLIMGFLGWAIWNLMCAWGETGRISPIIPPLLAISIIIVLASITDKWRRKI